MIGIYGKQEADGSLQPHVFAAGDALIFPSYKYHSVGRILTGMRQTLVPTPACIIDANMPSNYLRNWGQHFGSNVVQCGSETGPTTSYSALNGAGNRVLAGRCERLQPPV